MRIAKHIVVIGLVLFMMDTMAAFSAKAQNNASQIFVNYADVTSSNEGLDLNIYFTLNDALGQVVPAARVRSATIQLDDGNPLHYNAQVAQPDTPFYITLVLDASGSMSRVSSAEALRTAAIQAITNAPSTARFSIISFSEEIKVLTSPTFTSDRNRAINAIGEVIPINRQGTCLYDAAFQAVELLEKEAPDGRRAVLLFTDGVDERYQSGGCSAHTQQQVIDLANRMDMRTPIHTVGLRGAQNPINETDLRTLAESTGGMSAFGAEADLNALFERIMTALRSQWSASSVVYPSNGLRTATLLVTLTDGTPLRAVTTFNADKDYALVPTPTRTPSQNQTATPATVSIKVLGIQVDIPAHAVVVNVNVENGQRVSEYRFELKDASTNLLQGDGFVYPAPLGEQVRLSVGNLASGQYAVIVRALGADGAILASSNEERFAYTLPTATPTATATSTRTPTPTQPTNTPLPIGATLNNIQYLPAENVFRLYLTLMGEDQIAQLRVEFIDQNTRQLTSNPFFPDPAETIEITAKNMPSGSYDVVVISLDSANSEIARSFYSFSHLLPTPTPSATATATATPVVVSAVLGIPSASKDNQELVFPVQTANEELIKRFVLEFVDSNNFVVATLPYNTPPYDVLRVRLNDLGLDSGEYTITLKALDADGQLVAEETAISIRYTAPVPTPTVVSTSVPEEPAFPSTEWAKDHVSLVLPVIIVLIAALFLVLIVLLRKPRQQTGTGFLEELTHAQQIKDMPLQYTPSSPGAMDSDATNPVLQFDPDATNPIPQILLPEAFLVVNRSRDQGTVGQQYPITHVPFTIGRRDRDLVFPGDDNVSRNHADITFDQAEQRFYIIDNRSTHGTAVDGVPVQPTIPAALMTGAQIRIGMTTVLIFQANETAFDPEKTGGKL